MSQTSLPFFFMRGGTSRGPYFARADLPDNQEQLAQVLIAAVGSGHPLNIDGIGGGNAVTTKVAMLSKSDDDWADIDYYFAQVSVEDKQVDFKPTCGNILSGVGPAAIEMGLHPTQGEKTVVKIRAVNTGARVIANIETPDAEVNYAGDCAIDGVPGTAAPITLHFQDVAGSVTGKLFPTGNLLDVFDDIEVTCMDVAMPMVIAKATSFGLSGNESATELNNNRAFFERMESIRQLAGKKMGMGDVTESVTPKFGLIAKTATDNTIRTRYFMPWKTHPTMAVTGSQCLASCALVPGTVADKFISAYDKGPVTVTLEHPSGQMDVIVDFDFIDGNFVHKSAGLLRTARKLASGDIFVPSHLIG